MGPRFQTQLENSSKPEWVIDQEQKGRFMHHFVVIQHTTGGSG